MCGAAWSRNVICPIVLGLSPRVRGSQCQRSYCRPNPRSIPTCAGQPTSPAGRQRLIRVYPHVCGAAVFSYPNTDIVCGLSPRVRGSLDQATWTDKGWGSIPTCAGQPATYFTEMRVTAVYPHVCGAANGATYTVDITNGLFPRVRGSLSRRRSPTVLWRSIPTCAGQPRWYGLMRSTGTVYPHVCGAAPCVPETLSTITGLSPRVRGSPSLTANQGTVDRSIPTCAGQPSTSIDPASIWGVYPHVCGAAHSRSPPR